VPNTGPVSGRRQAGPVDDRRVGLIIRALRRRRGWRQSDLAVAAGVSQQLVSTIERGHVDTVAHGTLRRLLGALDARCEIDVRWRGGSLDRTLDENHARLVGATVALLAQAGWLSAVEVTYSVFGERGSIDVLGFHDQTGSLLVIEVKTEITSIEETLRRLDEKTRLAGQVARDRLQWRSGGTSRLLVLPETSTSRERVARHAGVLSSGLPAENVAVRRWLAAPSGSLHGRLFFRITNPRGGKETLGTSHRVRRPADRSNAARASTNSVADPRLEPRN
jgi:transcriptional regulator with XRE-family HTH domain